MDVSGVFGRRLLGVALGQQGDQKIQGRDKKAEGDAEKVGAHKRTMRCYFVFGGEWYYYEDIDLLFEQFQTEDEELKEALEESVKLQAHYAKLLNMYDEGKRIIFKNSQQWLDRLQELKIKNSRDDS